jgi:triacylglycerol lipase
MHRREGRNPRSRFSICGGNGARVFSVFMLMTALATVQPTASAAESAGCVVLLHGLARTHQSMAPMAAFLESAAYRTANIDYPSTEKPIGELAVAVKEGINQCRRDAPGKRIHIVTHSMGGILVRVYLKDNAVPDLGRVVMLSPPNQGSEAAEALRDLPFYRWLNGPAGQQLGTGNDSLPLSLGPVDFPLGIITGSESSVFDFWIAEVFPGENDGKVSVARAKVAGMTDFRVMPHNHTFIMQQEDVMEQVVFFLRNGRFHR